MQTTIVSSVGKIKFPSRIDIIIPFHGQYEMVSSLVRSIFRTTFSNVYQIILVDDCSPNAEFIKDLSSVSTLQCIRLDEQRGFGGAIRAGFEHSEKLNVERKEKGIGDFAYCVFMQSDCLVEDIGWLRSLGETLLDLKPLGVRMVGSRTDNPVSGDERQAGTKGQEIENVVLDKTHLGMHCFMVHRELFNHVGGFIKEYPFGGYEDEEFAYRLRKYGYKQGIAGKSFVKHVGSATFNEVYRNNPEAKHFMEKNRLSAIQDVRSLS